MDPNTAGNLTAAAGMDADNQDDLLADLDIFPADDSFPSLADFPCLSSPTSNPSFPSSSSSSSSTSSSSSSSCSSTSWPPPPPPPDADDVLPSLDDLLDQDLWDSSPLLPDPPLDDPQNGGVGGGEYLATGPYDDDLAGVFLEWLRSNKEAISPEDLRSIKLKRSTIENAARRLGGGREGMKHLLMLILAWVQDHHLRNRRLANPPTAPGFPITVPIMTGNPSPIYSAMQTEAFAPCGTWMPPQDPAALYPENDGLMEPQPAWSVPGPYSPPPPLYSSMAGHFPPPSPYVGGFGVPAYAMGPCFGQAQAGEQMARAASSATKEARKKRMARQRRFMSLHHHRNNGFHQPPPPPAASPSGSSSHGNDWLLWCNANGVTTSTEPQLAPAAEPNPTAAVATTKANPAAGMQQTSTSVEKRQGWKSEKNLKFLLQKVLKQSDVGSLGRIVLPKKEAEIHLPELEARDGIPITMEDIGTSRTWNMRYRYWPNNKSRMYLLENTGDFVRSNGLQEGDFIVIYSDVKCGKYMIRGVKVRKPGDSRTSCGSPSGCGSSSREFGIVAEDYKD